MRVATIVLILTTLIACNAKHPVASSGSSQPTTANAASLTPEQLGELGAQIHRNPDRAQELLKNQGLTAESFEKQIRAITENPDASRRYAVAYRRAGA